MINSELEVLLEELRRTSGLHEARLNECERLLALYQQMFRDIQSALRISGERFDNHQGQITNLQEQLIVEDKKVEKVCESLIRYAHRMEKCLANGQVPNK